MEQRKKFRKILTLILFSAIISSPVFAQIFMIVINQTLQLKLLIVLKEMRTMNIPNIIGAVMFMFQ
jgi:hypothetical protein